MKVVKDEPKKAQTFEEKWKEHKAKYLKEHSVAEMVYENGSALALLYKEVQRLNTNIMSVLKIEENGKERNNKN